MKKVKVSQSLKISIINYTEITLNEDGRRDVFLVQNESVKKKSAPNQSIKIVPPGESVHHLPLPWDNDCWSIELGRKCFSFKGIPRNENGRYLKAVFADDVVEIVIDESNPPLNEAELTKIRFCLVESSLLK